MTVGVVTTLTAGGSVPAFLLSGSKDIYESYEVADSDAFIAGQIMYFDADAKLTATAGQVAGICLEDFDNSAGNSGRTRILVAATVNKDLVYKDNAKTAIDPADVKALAANQILATVEVV